ncbi:MAG TPA: tRNA 2-selenouridine(34) synthase MnmH [Chitinophagaceae bacterium]|nr:tRNA 2-selenouridine(34) synthase MnmH [Chitinophagaceae bacterium]
MAVEKIYIERFLELAKQHPVIDVRSPAEYKHAHIPGAYSLPLFTDEERKIVGTAYKQESRERAIKIGLDFFGPKMRKMVEETESAMSNWQPANKNDDNLPIANCLLIYCWRGGMRSAGVAWLMDLYGFKVYTLTGGYKKFRNHVLDTFKFPFQFKLLGGYTGSGKTEVLKALQKKEDSVIDLEAIANHKGSAFGNIGMPEQPGQEMFENLLALELRQKSIANVQLSITSRSSNSSFTPDSYMNHDSSIWLEDESQRIGLVNIPNDLWNNMRQSPLYFLDISFEKRLEHLVQEYGQLDRERLIDAIGRIREKLGELNAKNAIQLLEEGNTIESFRILLKYYDKFYLKALHNREKVNSLLHTINCKSVTPENASELVPQLQYQPEKP